MANMERRSRRRNMSILPPINENEGKSSSRSKWWVVVMMGIASCGAGYTYHTNPNRRLSLIPRPQLRSIPKHTLLFDDGTLFAPEGAGPLCDYFTHSKRLHTEIKRLHLYLATCDDSIQQVEVYFEGLLLANAAQIPFTMTCGGEMKQDTLTSRLVVENIAPGPFLMKGQSWTASDLCRTDTVRLSLMKDAIKQTLKNIVPKTATDDIVLQFDPSVPISTYTELITEARFERGSIETVAIVGKGPHLLAKSLERTFPELSVQVVNEEEGLLHLYSRLMHAHIAGICSVPSVCSYAMLSGVGGFLNEEGCPEWISSAAREESSRVETFKVISPRVVT